MNCTMKNVEQIPISHCGGIQALALVCRSSRSLKTVQAMICKEPGIQGGTGEDGINGENWADGGNRLRGYSQAFR